MTAHLDFIEATAVFDVYPFKFTPFDLLLRMDTMNPDRKCWGLDYAVRTFLAEFKVELKVNECIQGLMGTRTNNDARDCTWRDYRP